METRKIGSLKASVVGLGCIDFGWRIDANETTKVVEAALDAGINFFDTADIYGKGQSEEFLGRALGRRRDDVLIATKFGLDMGDEREGAQPAYVQEAVEASLRRLGTDRIDLYQLHRPDPATPIADTLGTLQDIVRQGKVREIGCSNFSVVQIRAAAAATSDEPNFVSVQNELSLIQREAVRDVLPECAARGLAFLPYFPLASGLLTGKYRRGQEPPAETRASNRWGPQVFTDRNLKLVEKLIVFAQSRNQTLLDLAFAWLLARSSVASVIAGARRAEQVRDNVSAIGWQLTAADLSEIDEIVSA
ncbi:MAG TPA: aldo/keto reductase [Chthoniobacterales bacterium]